MTTPHDHAVPADAPTHFAREGVSSIGRFLRWSALILFVIFPLLVAIIFIAQSDRIAANAAARIPIEQEIQFGEHAFASLRASLSLQEGPAHDAVNRLGAQLTVGSEYDYRFYVAASDTIDAFAIPGGIIVVHRGLIEATRSPAELAGVLAHGVQHIEQRHSLAAVVKDLGLRGIWALFTGDLASGWIERAAVALTSLRFSNEAEMQADAQAIDALIAAQIDPRGMSEFFLDQSRRSDEGAAFFAAHAMSAEREAALRERLAAIGERQFEPLESGAWPPRKVEE